jgi:hypothetical protein
VAAREDSFAVKGAVDLLGSSRTEPLWGIASTDLNATLLAWPRDTKWPSTANPTTWRRAARFSSRAEHTGASRPMTLACATSQSTVVKSAAVVVVGDGAVYCGSGCGWRPVRRGRFRLICEGWVPQRRLFAAPGPRSRIERASRGWRTMAFRTQRLSRLTSHL